jgi:O-acetyl-ADP-ribose deacetylase (regulator of RNase III)
MHLILVALQENLAQAWEKYHADLEFVSVHRGSIFEVRCDAVVSPANSFGFMNGGIDLQYSQFFGWDLQKRLQRQIEQYHHGEMLIGSAEIVETANTNIPYMISAPTMRMPMTIAKTINPYLAARAVFLVWLNGTIRTGINTDRPACKVIHRIAMPGLGTGVGSVSPEICAKQIRAAIDDVILGKFEYPESWGRVMEKYEESIGEPFADDYSL